MRKPASVLPFSLVIALLSCTVVLFTCPRAYGNWFLGGGLEHVALEDDLDDFESAVGFTLASGFRVTPSFALDFTLTVSSHDEDVFGIEGDYSRLDVGAKFIFAEAAPVQPFAVLGISSHYLDLQFFDDIDGTGLFLGAGFEGFLNPASSVGFVVKNHWWDGEDVFAGGDYDVQTQSISVYFHYYFMGF